MDNAMAEGGQTLFLDLPPESISSIGGGKVKRTGIVDAAVIQSHRPKNAVQDLVA